MKTEIPAGIAFVGKTMWAYGLFLVAAALCGDCMMDFPISLAWSDLVLLSVRLRATGSFVFLIGIIYFICGLNIIKLKSWSRITAIILSGILTVGITLIFLGFMLVWFQLGWEGDTAARSYFQLAVIPSIIFFPSFLFFFFLIRPSSRGDFIPASEEAVSQEQIMVERKRKNLKVFIRCLFSVLTVIIFYIIASSFTYRYKLYEVRGLEFLYRLIDLFFALLWFNRPVLLMGYFLGWVAIVYAFFRVVEQIVKKFQISPRMTVSIVLLLTLILGTSFYFYVPYKAKINREKAKRHIEYLLPLVRSDSRFREVSMRAGETGKIEVSGSVQDEEELEALTGMVFSSTPPVEVGWYIGKPEKYEFDHELKRFKLKWEKKVGQAQ
jgi:hypothetical protein